jgi:hypothetical protein
MRLATAPRAWCTSRPTRNGAAGGDLNEVAPENKLAEGRTFKYTPRFVGGLRPESGGIVPQTIILEVRDTQAALSPAVSGINDAQAQPSWRPRSRVDRAICTIARCMLGDRVV